MNSKETIFTPMIMFLLHYLQYTHFLGTLTNTTSKAVQSFQIFKLLFNSVQFSPSFPSDGCNKPTKSQYDTKAGISISHNVLFKHIAKKAQHLWWDNKHFLPNYAKIGHSFSSPKNIFQSKHKWLSWNTEAYLLL